MALQIKYNITQWIGSQDGNTWLPILNHEIIQGEKGRFKITDGKIVSGEIEGKGYTWPGTFDMDYGYTTGRGYGSFRKPIGYILSLPNSHNGRQ